MFAVNHQQNFTINLLAIVVGDGILQHWAWVSGGVYKNWCLDALEGSFMLNLIILAAATYHVKVSEGNQLAVRYIHFCLHNTWNIKCDPFLPHLPATEARQAVEGA